MEASQVRWRPFLCLLGLVVLSFQSQSHCGEAKPLAAPASSSAVAVKASGAASTSPPAAPRVKPKWNPDSFRTFLWARTGSGPAPVYWALEGQLSNPFNGEVIAQVRGLEVTRCVGLSVKKGKKDAKPVGKGRLMASKALEAKKLWASATILSTKTFLYLDPRTGEPMTSFQPTPRSKPKPVPQAPPSLQAITYALTSDGALHLVSETPEGVLLEVDDQPSAAPKPKRGWGLNLRLPGVRTFELSLLMWPGSKPARGPAWTSLVQLGGSSAQPPCRELYALRVGDPFNPRPRLRYLRYGEGPWWCGAGRVCNLALEGTRYTRPEDLPRSLRQLLVKSGQGDKKGLIPLPKNVDAFKEAAKPKLPKRFILF